jgi:hypothetical protein
MVFNFYKLKLVKQLFLRNGNAFSKNIYNRLREDTFNLSQSLQLHFMLGILRTGIFLVLLNQYF